MVLLATMTFGGADCGGVTVATTAAGTVALRFLCLLQCANYGVQLGI